MNDMMSQPVEGVDFSLEVDLSGSSVARGRQMGHEEEYEDELKTMAEAYQIEVERAKEELLQKQSALEYKLAQNELARAMARLKYKNHKAK